MSFATVSPPKMELTPCRVSFKGFGAGSFTDLGGTLSGVSCAWNYTKAEIMADQFGKTVLDRVVSGFTATISFEIAEVLEKDNWKVVFPNAILNTSGPNKSLTFLSQVGAHDLERAGQLKLHPLSKVDADLSGDILFYSVVADEKSEIVFSPDKQQALKFVMNVYPDTSVQPAKFCHFGDPAIGQIAATAGAPSFVGTGNGTMTSVVVYSGLTRTETITATLVTVSANGGVFHVEGSISGSLGLATVATPFISPEISFTINDGATDFVLADEFTVLTTAANYV